MNPLDNACAKLKAMLRARAARSIGALRDAGGTIVNLFSPDKFARRPLTRFLRLASAPRCPESLHQLRQFQRKEHCEFIC